MTNERISAWLDGELQGGTVAADAATREACAAWWLIGDVMRREKLLSPDFSLRVMQALESEPTVLAPRAAPVVAADRPAANMPRWMPVAAAVSGVVVVAWAMLGTRPEQRPAAEVAVVAKVAPVERTELALVRAPAAQQEDETRAYLLAHQANGRGVQMAGVSGYVRPVSFDQGLVASR
ncbi:MAG: sigma-E factor negative regulatory protein [Rhodocyclaceae bacterium]